MKTNRPAASAALAALLFAVAPEPASLRAADAPASASASAPSWPTGPVSVNQALEIALRQNPAIQKSRLDIEEAHGLSLQQRATYLPKVAASGAYNAVDSGKIETAPFGPGGAPVAFQNDQNWNASVQVSQPVFQAGKLRSAARASKLTREAALANHLSLVADTLVGVRVAYQDVLLAAEQISVQLASIRLLEQELADTKRRFDAGTVPRFNVLRAEVELANAKPRLIRARNSHRIAKNNLANLLGYNVPREVSEDIPLELADRLQAEPHDVALATALARGLQQRSELKALRLAERLRDEDVKQARADYYPHFSVGAGYGWQSRTFGSPAVGLDDETHGWTAGAQLNWSVFDFGLTQGRVQVAQARKERARIDTADVTRRIELDIRTAHSNFVEAKEILEAQQKVIEQAEEALRLANARAEAGTGTQLDVLSAQTALTETRTVYSQALRDYAVAWARFERAMGDGVSLAEKK